MTSNTINDAPTVSGNSEGTLLANRYRIVRQLGRGGMGSVWLAEDTQLDNKLFAIKMLPSILVANKRAYRQLKDEALVAMRLVHPNIVQIRAFEENDGNPFLVMDYIDGQTLDDYLAEHGGDNLTQSRGGAESQGDLKGGSGCGLPEEDVVRILKPIAAALDYAHGEGVVHRDVKPANVMIRKDGHPFILDFGIAREIQETMTRVTGKLSSGTLLYMSPEQLHGAQPKKEQDIYSFAAMAYECLKGEPPFNRGQIEYQIDNDVPEPLPGGPRSIAAAIMAGLAKKPEGRPASCAAVLEGNLSTQRREDAEAQGGRAGAPRTPQGGSRFGAAMTALAVALVLAGGYFGWMKYDEGVKSREAETVRQKAAAEEAERIAKASATEIRIEACVQQSAVGNISDEDGFRAKKDDLSKDFARADALFDDKVRRWSEAAVLFTNYVAGCRALIKLDGERRTAMGARTKADEAKDSAERADAEKYAPTRWSEAVRLQTSANAEFARMQFADAGRSFASAAGQFDRCTEEANAERSRQAAEVARKKVEAERLAKQQQEEARKAAEAEKAAIAAREKAEADKAMALQVEKRALALLARDPLQYESVSMYFTKEQRDLLSPLYQEIVRGEAELNGLLEKLTELNPRVVGTRKEQNFRVMNFKCVVMNLQNGRLPSASLASPTERFDDYVVKADDTFVKIARSHGAAIEALMELNGLDSYQLRVGQVLKVPIKTTSAKPKVNDGKRLLIKDSGTAFLSNAIMPFVQNGSLPGAIGVLYKNGCQETACMGWANVGKRIPMSMDRTFMICSQSKGFCGVCVALLVEEGKINLDDPISRYLPQFANMIVEIKDGNSVKRRAAAQNEITIRHLLTHSAGFPFDVPSVLEKGWTSCPISQVVAEAAANPLVAEPGTKAQYSNVGFAIAAAIIEKLSGRRYEEFLEKRIFNPLGMGDTTFKPTDEQLSRQISMYTISKNTAPVYTPENKRMPLPHNGPTVYACPAMGLWSTADDLLKFYQMIMLKGVGANGVRLLQEQTVLELLATSQRPPSLQGYYSLGFTILQDEPGWLGHGGAWGTYFKININKQELCLWVVQLCGGPRPWDVQREEAAKSFFRNVP